MPEMPAYWSRMCVTSLQSRVGLAKELWQIFCELHAAKAQGLAYALNKLDFEPANPAIVQQRLAHLQRALTPQNILAACGHLSPEGKGRRRQDVVALETHLLNYVDAHGNFK
jgi:hypothetical protein